MNYQLTDGDNGRALELQAKDQFELTLRESRMSGYRWTLEESGQPFLSHKENKTQPKPEALGQPNIRSWQFTAEEAGTTQVRLRHARSWEPPSSGSEFVLSVKVSG